MRAARGLAQRRGHHLSLEGGGRAAAHARDVRVPRAARRGRELRQVGAPHRRCRRPPLPNPYCAPWAACNPGRAPDSRAANGSLPSRLAEPPRALAAPRHGHRLDRRVVLLRLARQSPAAARAIRPTPRRAWAASCGRFTAAASTTRRSTASLPPRCPRRCTGSSGRPTGPGSRASSCSRSSTTSAPRSISSTATSRISASRRRSASASPRIAGGWLIYDRLCASPLGGNDRALAAVLALLVAAAAYGLAPRLQRPRRVHPLRRHARHDHGGERVLRHHPRPARAGAGEAARAASPTRSTGCAASSAPCTTPISRCRCCSR